MIRLLIARHGNTFDAGDVLRRVGRGTDLPLSSSGQEQAQFLGEYLRQYHPQLAAVYSSTLMRTFQTATTALEVMQLSLPVTQTEIFDEVDYGPDEGQPEQDVLARLGKHAIEQWDQHNVVPDGWNVDPVAITQSWQTFADAVEQQFNEQTILVVTSNGNARFAPNHTVKLSTGAVSLMTIDQGKWSLEYANRRPIKELNHAEV